MTVSKVYDDGNRTAVIVTLTCSNGTVSPPGTSNSGSANSAPGSPATFTVTGFGGGAGCSATEAVPSGYLQQSNNCNLTITPGADLICTIFNVADADGDGVPDALDNCLNWYNPSQTFPPWPVPLGPAPLDDPDCDGFTTAIENFVGTDPAAHCGVNAWPVDLNNDGKVTTQDVLKYIGKVNTSTPGPPYNVRFDLNMDGKITTQDVLKLLPFLNKSCTP